MILSPSPKKKIDNKDSKEEIISYEALKKERA
jgi:hypothetical protein